MPAAAEDRRVVLLCPTSWDLAQLDRMPEASALMPNLLIYGDDLEHAPENFDADAFIRTTIDILGSQNIIGVTSSSDYPGCIVAAFVARELGLPGPSPESVLRCSHKYYSRLAQRAAVPEATPRFVLIDPDHLDESTFPLAFPIFVKPVKSWFSQYARRIESFADLRNFADSPGVRWHLTNFVRPFNQMLSRFGEFAINGGYLIGEELLSGHQVTLEGYAWEGRTTVVGIVDSLMYENTPSFQRFDCPSSISPRVAERMAGITERAMSHIGFRHGLFNIEFFYNEVTDAVQIIEINPRMCGQFADLMEYVNGTNTYDLLLRIATGTRPPTSARSVVRGHAATSFVLRHFRDSLVRRVPDRGTLDAALTRYSVSLVENYYQEGELLSVSDYQFDGFSYRYAVVNMFGNDHRSLAEEFEEVRTFLGYELVEAGTETNALSTGGNARGSGDPSPNENNDAGVESGWESSSEE